MSQLAIERRSAFRFAPDRATRSAERLAEPADMSVRALSWPLSSLGEGIEELVRQAGLRPVSGEPIAVPGNVMHDNAAELERWIAWAGERLGVEAKPVEATAANLEPLLLKAGPAIFQFDESDGPRFFLVLKSRSGTPRLLTPDLELRSCAIEDLRDMLCAAHEAPLIAEIDHLLDVAEVPTRRRKGVRSIIARERLASRRMGGCWIFQLPPTVSFWRQIKQASVPRKLAAMLGLFAVVYGLEILGWSVIGDAALNGRLDLGWLTAWILLVMSIIPLSLLGTWFNATLALDVSRLLKTRLLLGALQIDIEAVRHQGAGQLLGRVMESQAFEALVLSGGIAALVAVVELGFSAWILSLGSGGLLHVVLLLLWLPVAVGMSSKYFRRLRDWTLMRLGMTHELVERMSGHRTTLAQEWPARRDQHEDRTVKDYLNASAGVDRSVIPFLGGVPTGWMFLGLAGLAPAFVSGSGTPVGLAIGLGGVMLANRAFNGIASGLASVVQAVIAWKQVGPLFKAAARPPSTLPFVTLQQMQPQDGDGAVSQLIEAEGLTYRYQAHGDRVLRGASLTIRHGERLLVEGASGGGKSTLASLLVGLRKPDSGLLLLNGLDRHTLGDSWHRFATEAPQFHENYILSGTIGFNLLMGRNWPASDKELTEASDLCEELGLGELLRRMPSGMMQTVGETGWQLSHGERSRIFLARALLQDAQLTVLDESFAALDPETLQQCLDCALRRARTLVVIAHP